MDGCRLSQKLMTTLQMNTLSSGQLILLYYKSLLNSSVCSLFCCMFFYYVAFSTTFCLSFNQPHLRDREFLEIVTAGAELLDIFSVPNQQHSTRLKSILRDCTVLSQHIINFNLRPDSLMRLWCGINHLLTYLLTYLHDLITQKVTTHKARSINEFILLTTFWCTLR